MRGARCSQGGSRSREHALNADTVVTRECTSAALRRARLLDTLGGLQCPERMRLGLDRGLVFDAYRMPFVSTIDIDINTSTSIRSKLIRRRMRLIMRDVRDLTSVMAFMPCHFVQSHIVSIC